MIKHFPCYFLLILTLNIFSQTQDVKRIDAEIEVFFKEKYIKGILEVEVDILNKTNEIYLDSKNIAYEYILLDKDTMDYELKGDKVFIKGDFEPKSYRFQIRYTSSPKQTLYFVNDLNGPQIFTQGQGKYTSHWLPSIDDMTDKIEFDISVIAPKELSVVANGRLQNKNAIAENKQRWDYDMAQPMSSYLVALAIGNFEKEMRTSASGIPIELYYEPQDANKVEPTYRYSKEIFDFLEKDIGVAYPWQNYKQVYVKDFLYAGMENTSATFFSDAFVTDDIGFLDRNYVNVNAHELAHQWFGNLVTEESSSHHWLHEGFATYYALLAEREIFGDNYYYWQLYKSAERLKDLSDKGQGEALTDPQASSITFYEKGAWALHILREKVGDEAFRKGVKQYLETHKFQNVTIANFLNAVAQASDMDLADFKKTWLEQSAFKADEALKSLNYSAFMQSYFQLSALRPAPLADKADIFFNYLSDPNINDYIGQEIAFQLSNEPYDKVLTLMRMAFNTNNILVRQAIVANSKVIPKVLQSEFESLLADKSYKTQELALFSLWQNFPQKRTTYLQALKGVEGFSDKNIKLLWLTLNLATQNYEPKNKSMVFKELTSYTDVVYSYQIRENAFNYLYQIEAFSDISLANLVNATTHHVWRFKKFSRELLKEILKNGDYKNRILSLKETFNGAEAAYLKTVL